MCSLRSIKLFAAAVAEKYEARCLSVSWRYRARLDISVTVLDNAQYVLAAARYVLAALYKAIKICVG
jgi:hypothetical protein